MSIKRYKKCLYDGFLEMIIQMSAIVLISLIEGQVFPSHMEFSRQVCGTQLS